MDMDSIKAARASNPLYNAPPCLSELHGDARKQMLAARDRAARMAYLDRYRTPPKPGVMQRAIAAVRRMVGTGERAEVGSKAA